MDEWRETTDPSTGKTYYYNKRTKQTSWTKPAEASAQLDVDGNPANWSEATDPNSKRIYYYNKITKKTSWQKPACLVTQPSTTAPTGTTSTPVATPTTETTSTSAAPSASPSTLTSGDISASVSASTTSSTAPITPATTASATPAASTATPASNPDLWIETVDPRSGKHYWYHKITKQTTWKDPRITSLTTQAGSNGAAGGSGGANIPSATVPISASSSVISSSASSIPSSASFISQSNIGMNPLLSASTLASSSSATPLPVTPSVTSPLPSATTSSNASFATPTSLPVTPSLATPLPVTPSVTASSSPAPSHTSMPSLSALPSSSSLLREDSDSSMDSGAGGEGKGNIHTRQSSQSVSKTIANSNSLSNLKNKDNPQDGSKKKNEESDDEDPEVDKGSDDEDKYEAAKRTEGEKGEKGEKEKGEKGEKGNNEERKLTTQKSFDTSRMVSAVDKKLALQNREADDIDKGADSDEEADDHNLLKFATHRKGFMKRLLRMGEAMDEAKLLSFKKSLIKKALLKQNRDLDAEAIQAFKNIMSYMGDRKSSKKPLEHARKILGNLMVAPAGLRDEVYMQLWKQTTNNPRIESTVKGWELMSFCLCTFPPSKHLKSVLTEMIQNNIKDTTRPQVSEMAKLCLERLKTIVVLGQRKQVPSRLELQMLMDNKPVTVKVSLLNGSEKTFTVDSFTFVKDVNESLAKKFNLVCETPFALYESAGSNVERLLDSKDRLLDVVASWENAEEKDKDKDKKGTLGVRPKYNSFVYKAKLVLKTSDPDIAGDPEAVNMLYIQAVHDVVTFRYPINEKDITVLAALQLQATCGDFKESTHNDEWLISKIEEIIPMHLLAKKGKAKKDEKLTKEWSQKILVKYSKVSGFTSQEAKLNYLDYVQEWTFYGATFFTVEQRQFKDYPSPLTLAVTCEGVLLMHPEKKNVLENYQFTDIVTWGHSDEKFIIVVGNIVQQRKLIFKTAEGKAMNHLIHDYVKFKVKTKN